jgi:hypothetical protein
MTTEEKQKVLPVALVGEYKNINLKVKYERDANKNFVVEDGHKVVKEDGLGDGEYIVVKKMFVDGQEFKSKYPKIVYSGGKRVEEDAFNYLCKAIYNDGAEDHEVSFWLNEDEHNQYKECGGVDDQVKIINIKQTFVNKKTGAEGLKDSLNFVKVE